jgi:rod shape-determining protein MreC
VIELTAPINYLEWATVYPNSANLGEPQLIAPPAPTADETPAPKATP